MNENRYIAQAVSRKDIRNYAKDLRKCLRLENKEYIDIVWLMENVFPTLFKRYNFSVEYLPKEAMGSNHGLSDPRSGKIFIREDVYEGACRGVGRDRLTFAHELGHFLLHNGVTIGLARAGEKEEIPIYCDPEWQATVFAAEFLMDHDLIQKMTVNEVAQRCGVSMQAAQIQKEK